MNNTLRSSTVQRRLDAKNARATIHNCTSGIHATIEIERALRKLIPIDEPLREAAFAEEVSTEIARMYARRRELERTASEALRTLRALRNTEAF